jgi:hypothetical protein
MPPRLRLPFPLMHNYVFIFINMHRSIQTVLRKHGSCGAVRIEPQRHTALWQNDTVRPVVWVLSGRQRPVRRHVALSPFGVMRKTRWHEKQPRTPRAVPCDDSAFSTVGAAVACHVAGSTPQPAGLPPAGYLTDKTNT